MNDLLVQESQQSLLAVLDGIQHTRPAFYGKSKVIHDPIWGTCEYEAWEARLLDHALFQRLRGLRTGLAYLTYPTAEHSRFQHTLGVTEAAGRIDDAVVHRAERGGLSPMGLARRAGHPIFDTAVPESTRRRWRMLVRLAALVHDTGHSVFSHSSERIYGLVPPLPDLIQHLTTPNAKPPGAAEVIVYLVVTTTEWQERVAACWDEQQMTAPTSEEWKRIGQWVMGQEEDKSLKFLADIISGPLDADKLDYVFRDGYSACIPVGYDLERLIATVCVDPQESVDGGSWWRLTIPVRGINALEQGVMGRLVLNSYMYHHQKCRAAEAAFERALARDYRAEESVLGLRSVWDLFGLQDADAYAFRLGDSTAALELRSLYGRGLRVRVAEFRRVDLPDSSRISPRFARLLEYSRINDWPQYYELLDLEDQIGREAGLDPGSVIVDIPSNPSYADLENLLIPGRRAEAGEDAHKVLAYRDWIEAYKVHRMFVRVFGPRGAEAAVWEATRTVLQGHFDLDLPDSVRIRQITTMDPEDGHSNNALRRMCIRYRRWPRSSNDNRVPSLGFGLSGLTDLAATPDGLRRRHAATAGKHRPRCELTRRHDRETLQPGGACHTRLPPTRLTPCSVNHRPGTSQRVPRSPSLRTQVRESRMHRQSIGVRAGRPARPGRHKGERPRIGHARLKVGEVDGDRDRHPRVAGHRPGRRRHAEP